MNVMYAVPVNVLSVQHLEGMDVYHSKKANRLFYHVTRVDSLVAVGALTTLTDCVFVIPDPHRLISFFELIYSSIYVHVNKGSVFPTVFPLQGLDTSSLMTRV
jgi:hypothetical protein